MQAFEIRTVRLFLLMWILGSITVDLQAYVGHSTLYPMELQDKREELHRAILSNKALGEGHCKFMGANSMNLRIGAIYLAELILKFAHLEIINTAIKDRMLNSALHRPHAGCGSSA